MSALFLGGLPSSELNRKYFDGGFFTEADSFQEIGTKEDGGFLDCGSRSDTPESKTSEPIQQPRKRGFQSSSDDFSYSRWLKTRSVKKVWTWESTRLLLDIVNETLERPRDRKRLRWQLVAEEVMKKTNCHLQVTRNMCRQRIAYLCLLLKRKDPLLPEDLRLDVVNFNNKYHLKG